MNISTLVPSLKPESSLGMGKFDKPLCILLGFEKCSQKGYLIRYFLNIDAPQGERLYPVKKFAGGGFLP